MAVAADLSMPEVEGHRGPVVRVMNAYVDRVQAAASRDADVADGSSARSGCSTRPRP